MSLNEINIDNFAGGGGASTGLAAAIGRPVDHAINHSANAIAMHRANHPETQHHCENVWEIDPRELAAGRRVKRVWLSPDCTHFSRARGGVPRSKGTRGLAWVAVRYARTVKPDVMFLENVEEFEDWGPLLDDGTPDKGRAGETFRAFVASLVSFGYAVEWRVLVAADYGAPTTRKRLFLIARRDGRPIVWPEATHGAGRSSAWRTAAEIIDWTIPCPSIFERKRPLAEATQRRIAAGLRRYVFECASPFIVPVKSWGGGGNGPRGIDEPLRTVTCSKRGEHALVTPFVAKHYGNGDFAPRPGIPCDVPLATVTAREHFTAQHATFAPVEAGFVEKFYSTARAGTDAREPLPTVTATGTHLAEVRAFLVKYYGDAATQRQRVDRPIDTITAKARFGLVTVHGVDYQLVDIGLRMLAPRELYNAQGFPRDYIIDVTRDDGHRLTKAEQIELCGNSVCPDVARAIVAANTYERWEAVA